MILAAGTAGLVALHAVPLTHRPYADWAAASAEARQALGLAVVWAAACSAWVASLHSSPSSITCPTTALRSGPSLVAAQTAVLSGAGLVGLALGLTPLYAWCARNSTYNTDLRPLVIIGGASIIVAGVALGYLCGTVLPRLLAAPTAAAIAFATVISMGVDGRPAATIWPFDVAAGIKETTGVGIFRTVFFLTAGALFLVAASRWLGTRTVAAAPIAALVVTLAPVAGVAHLSNAHNPALISREVVAPRCERSAHLRVCVHPASKNLLPSLTAGLESLRSAIGPGLIFPANLSDGRGPITADGLVIDLPADRTWRAAAMLSVANAVLGTRACWSSVSGDGSPADVTGAAALWYAASAEPRVIDVFGHGPTGAMGRTLLQAPAPVVGERLRQALPALHACRATLDQLMP